jgi:hypothetical protein
MNSGNRSEFPEKPRIYRPLGLELIFHPLGDCTEKKSATFAEAIRRVLASDKSGEAHLVCPYLSCQVVSHIIHNRVFRLVTDIQACFEAGADEPLATFFEEHMDKVRHMPGVHAKVVTTNRAALLGSANFTRSGLGARDEMGCLIDDVYLVRTLRDWFDSLWYASRPLQKQDVLSSRNRPLRRYDTVGTESICSSKALHHPARSIGWMEPGDVFTSLEHLERDSSEATPSVVTVRREREALVAQLKKLANSRAQANIIVRLLAQALELSGLSLEDGRLHLNFGKRPICVSINQRYVAWCSVEKHIPQFGFILDSSEMANRTIHLLPGSWAGNFLKRGTDDLPTLHVPLEQLSQVSLEVLDSWRRAIRIEVDRRRRDGRPWISGYRKHIRPYLFYVLRDESLREEILQGAFPDDKILPTLLTSTSRVEYECWWLGVNNGPHGHIRLDDMQDFLSNAQKTFTWPIGKSKPKRLYGQMRFGDHVLLWVGHGRNPCWGIIGHARVVHVADDEIVLDEYVRFSSPIAPYPLGQPQETENVKFLRETFGADFVPLGDVMRAVYGTKRTPPITISPVNRAVFQSVLKFTES